VYKTHTHSYSIWSTIAAHEERKSFTWRESRSHREIYNEMACVHACIWLHSLLYTPMMRDNGAVDPSISRTGL